MSGTELPKTKVLVTGANGFVGRSVTVALAAAGWDVLGAVRRLAAPDQITVGNIGPETDWHQALQGEQVVIHLAARVHVMHEAVRDPLAAFRVVNTAGTLQLARQAALAGVRRFVFLSSIKVNGEETTGHVYTEADAAQPHDPYAISKWEAEQGLNQIAAETGMEVVILRPPLVYGPGVSANFLRLLYWVDNGVPLPLASIDNRRSMIYLSNLVDALMLCTTHPSAAGRTYLVSDGFDVATPELMRTIAVAMGKTAQVWPCPEVLLRAVARLLGKRDEAVRLLGSLQVDSRAIRRELGWAPPYTLQAGIQATVDWYAQHKNGDNGASST